MRWKSDCKIHETRRGRRTWCLLVSVVLCLSFTAMTQSVWASAVETRLSEVELDIWRSAAFQRQFAESYLAETEIEPRVTQAERDRMLSVLELISSDSLDEAARMLQRHTKDASSAVFDFTLANIYFQKDQLEPAAEAYERAVAKFPKFRRAWKNLGLIYVRSGEFSKAIPALTRTIELGGGDALTYGLLGFAYASVENNLAAESAYRLAVLLDPATLDWKMGLARSLFRQQRYADAAALCETLIAENPGRADLWLLQANAYIGLNEPLKAAINYELVDHMGKSTADSLTMLGDIYVNQELFEIAVAEGSGQDEIRVLEEIVALDPLEGEALILLGQYCARAGDFEKAVFYYERAQSLEKHEADARVRHAQLLVQQGKYTEALPLLRRAQDLKPREDVQKYLEQVERVARSR